MTVFTEKEIRDGAKRRQEYVYASDMDCVDDDGNEWVVQVFVTLGGFVPASRDTLYEPGHEAYYQDETAYVQSTPVLDEIRDPEDPDNQLKDRYVELPQDHPSYELLVESATIEAMTFDVPTPRDWEWDDD